MYFILEGAVDVVNEETEEVRVTIESGKYFGEMAIMNEIPSTRTASVRTQVDCSLAILDREAFHFVLNTFPEFAQAVN